MSAFWNFVTSLVPGTLAKAEDLNTNLDGVNTGFNLVEAEINKAIQITNSPGVTDIGLNAAARANKLISFDVNGDIAATTIIGDWKGDHADAAGTDYEIRDVVKDAAGSLGQDNIYICISTHTSTGSLLTDTANWDLVLDAVAAANSAAAALVSENAAAASYDLFDDRMLGAFSNAGEPTLDNDGDALVTGAMYFNTTINRWKVYNGISWQIITASASDVTIADAGAIYAASEVEAALQEVMTDLNSHIHSTFDRASSVLAGANVFSDLAVTDGIVTAIGTRVLTIANLGITATAAEVNYTTDVTSNIQDQLNLKAALVSPALTGNPTAPTQSATDDGTSIATTAFVNKAQGVAKAWVNFDGNLATPASRDSFNVSSISDIGVGSYRANFTTAMPNANYAVGLATTGTSAGNVMVVNSPVGANTTAYVGITVYDIISARDRDVAVIIFGD